MEQLQRQNSTHHYGDGVVGAVSLYCESTSKVLKVWQRKYKKDIKETEGNSKCLLQKRELAKSCSVCPKKKKINK